MSDLARASRHPILVVVVYLAAWTGLDAISSIYQANSGVSVWYPPTALDFVLLLVFGLRYAPVLLLMGLPHGLFFRSPGQGVWLTIPLDVTTAAVYVVAASVLLRHARIDPRLLIQRDVSWFLWVACVGAPLLVAILQVVQLTAAGPLRWADFAPTRSVSGRAPRPVLHVGSSVAHPHPPSAPVVSGLAPASASPPGHRRPRSAPSH